MAESLYGLCRAGRGGAPLTTRQRALSALALALLPYLRRKAEREYVRRAGTRTHAAPRPDGEEGAPEEEAVAAAAPPPATPAARLFLRVFPYAHAAAELSMFAGGLAYVLGASRTHSPLLALLSLRLRRATAADARDFASRAATSRSRLLSPAASAAYPPPLRLLRGLALRGAWTVVDAARPALLASLLGFKLLEWWFGTAEQALAQPLRLPVPPPPPPLAVAPGGVSLPKDKRLCPLCLKKRTNPALSPPSGIAFCFPCIAASVEQTGRCPVTGVPLAKDQVRRLYPGTATK